MILGNIGSPNRADYTAIGDTVNLAARIMGLTKSLSTDILISEDTYLDISEIIEAKDMGSHSVKGRQQQVRVFSPTGRKSSEKQEVEK